MSGSEEPGEALAYEMFIQTMEDGQSARRIENEGSAAAVREALRRLGRSAGVRLRTARMEDLVVVARMDATIWNDDAKTMRAKLAPPS